MIQIQWQKQNKMKRPHLVQVQLVTVCGCLKLKIRAQQLLVGKFTQYTWFHINSHQVGLGYFYTGRHLR